MDTKSQESKKRVISQEQREKMTLGRKQAAEKRKAEKALSTQAIQYQTETLENAKKDKENQRILKEEFERIKKRISDNQNPPKKLSKRLDMDELEQQEPTARQEPTPKEEKPIQKVEPTARQEPKVEIVEKLIVASKHNEERVSEWDENELEKKKTKFNEAVQQICSSMPNQKTRDIFSKAVGQYDINLSLNENIKNLINECNNQIQINATYIKEKDNEQKKAEQLRKKKEDDLAQQKKDVEDLDQKKKLEHEKRLKEFYRLLNKK